MANEQLIKEYEEVLAAERKAYWDSAFYFIRDIASSQVLRSGEENGMGVLHREMVGFLNGKEKRSKVMLVPREHLKTTVMMGNLIWRIIREPEIAILIVSSTVNLSSKILGSIKGIMKSEKFVELFGHWQGDLWSESEIVVNRRKNVGRKEPTITIAGLDSEVTGGHYDIIVFDDVVTWFNCQDAEQLVKVKDYYQMIVPVLSRGTVGKADWEMWILGTRYHQGDFYGWILDEIPDDFAIMVREIEENGKYIFPEKFDKATVDDLETKMGKAKFSAQYRNRPIDTSSQRFRQEFLQYFNEEDLEGRPLFTYITVDPSFGGRDGDYTAIMVISVDCEENLYFRDYIHDRYEYHARGVQAGMLEDVVRMGKKYEGTLRLVGIEEERYKKALKSSLEELMNQEKIWFTVRSLKSGRQKNAKGFRIESLQPKFEAKKVFIKSWMHELEAELLSYPVGRHDDLIDAAGYIMDKENGFGMSPLLELENAYRYEPDNEITGW